MDCLTNRMIFVRSTSILGFAALAGCGVLATCGGCRPTANPTAPPTAAASEPIRPQLQRVNEQSWPTLVRTQGSLVADEATWVGARVAGRVETVAVEVGDLVDVSTPLVSLEQLEFRLEVDAAKARLGQFRAAVGLKPEQPRDSLDPLESPPVREARAVWDDTQQQVNRMLQLQDRSAISLSELETAQSAAAVAEARYASAVNSVREKLAMIHVAEAELALAEQRLADTIVSAPYAGVIRQRVVAPGSFVQVGDPLVELVRNSVVRYQASVPERYARMISVGRRIWVSVEGRPEPIAAEVTRISPTLDPANRSLMFEADILNPDGNLRSGQFAEATVELDPQAMAIAIPQSAVIRFAGVEKVWRVVDGRAADVVVQLGRRQGSQVEILGGLQPGDVIVVQGSEGKAAPVASPLPPDPAPHTAVEPTAPIPEAGSGT